MGAFTVSEGSIGALTVSGYQDISGELQKGPMGLQEILGDLMSASDGFFKG